MKKVNLKIVATNEGSKDLLNKGFGVENSEFKSLPFFVKTSIDDVDCVFEFKSLSFLNGEILMHCFVSSLSGSKSGKVIVKQDL